MARLGRGRPNRPILLRNPSFNQAATPTGNLNVTLDAFTLSASATFGASPGHPQVAVMGAHQLGGYGRHPVAVGPNLVSVMPRRRRRHR